MARDFLKPLAMSASEERKEEGMASEQPLLRWADDGGREPDFSSKAEGQLDLQAEGGWHREARRPEWGAFYASDGGTDVSSVWPPTP